MKRDELLKELAARGLRLDKFNAIKSKSGNTRLKFGLRTVKLFTKFHNGRNNEWLSLGTNYYSHLRLEGDFLLKFEHYMGTAKKVNLTKF